MPKLISFDIGIRNLAYCIFSIDDISTVSIQDWNVIDISLETKKSSTSDIKTCNFICKKGKGNNLCSKKAKYFLGSLCFCEKHAKLSEYQLPSKEFEKTQIKKLSVDSLQDFILKWKIPMDLGKKNFLPKGEKIEIIMKWIENNILQKIDGDSKKKKGEALDFIQIGRNMVEHLSKIDLAEIDYVVIENQISPIANKMRTIQGMLAQIFILQKVPSIEFVSSSNKLREYLGEKKGKTGEKKTETEEKKMEFIQNPDYKQHKKDGIRFTREWLESPKGGFTNWKVFFDSFPKKQDDLADAFLQGIWYLRKKMGVSLEK